MPRRNRVTALWLLVSVLRFTAAFTTCGSGPRSLECRRVHGAHRESTLRESSVSLLGQNDGGHAPPPPPAETPPSVDEDFVQDFLRLRNEIRKYSNSDLYRKYSAIIPMTVSILRRLYGERANWWGDLSASETRLLYWRLLPSVLLIEEEFKDLPLKDRAYIASMARYAAKLYARERSMVPERAAVSLYDASRSVLKTGKWSWTGLTVEDIWLKYEREVKAELQEESWLRDAAHASSADLAGATLPSGDPSSSSSGALSADADRELYRRLYQRIIQRSCATNPMVDRLAMLTPGKVAGTVLSKLTPGALANRRAAAPMPAKGDVALLAAQRRAAAIAATQEARLLGEARLLRGTDASADVARAAAAEKQRAEQLVRLLHTVRWKDKVMRCMASANFASLLADDKAAQSNGEDGPDTRR